MANTTNFGWETPDDTDLVKDGAAAIRTLAGAIDTSLVDLKGGTTGQVLAKNSNTDMDFVWSADASGIPATIFDAKGDLIVASAADTAARLGVGTNGHTLVADSSTATGLAWAAPAGGKVLQVVQTTKLNTFSTNSTSFTDITDLSVSITPASASNKVLVFAFTNGSTTGSTAMINLVRNSTAIFQPSGSPSLPSVANVTSGSSDRNVSATISFLDSPSTTSATTYKVQIKMESGTQTVYVNRRADSADHAYTSSIIAMEIGA